jgi:hypothetical protein
MRRVKPDFFISGEHLFEFLGRLRPPPTSPRIYQLARVSKVSYYSTLIMLFNLEGSLLQASLEENRSYEKSLILRIKASLPKDPLCLKQSVKFLVM